MVVSIFLHAFWAWFPKSCFVKMALSNHLSYLKNLFTNLTHEYITSISSFSINRTLNHVRSSKLCKRRKRWTRDEPSFYLHFFYFCSLCQETERVQSSIKTPSSNISYQGYVEENSCLNTFIFHFRSSSLSINLFFKILFQ